MKITEGLFCILVVIVIVVGIFVTYKSSKACSDSGGVLVRGIMWYECVKK